MHALQQFLGALIFLVGTAWAPWWLFLNQKNVQLCGARQRLSIAAAATVVTDCTDVLSPGVFRISDAVDVWSVGPLWGRRRCEEC